MGAGEGDFAGVGAGVLALTGLGAMVTCGLLGSGVGVATGVAGVGEGVAAGVAAAGGGAEPAKAASFAPTPQSALFSFCTASKLDLIWRHRRHLIKFVSIHTDRGRQKR